MSVRTSRSLNKSIDYTVSAAELSNETCYMFDVIELDLTKYAGQPVFNFTDNNNGGTLRILVVTPDGKRVSIVSFTNSERSGFQTNGQYWNNGLSSSYSDTGNVLMGKVIIAYQPTYKAAMTTSSTVEVTGTISYIGIS